ncbi:XdhC family protein [Streptosporangium sp. NPDC002721]|uniref:XdhC family protein n=1 Tax=Streptosporangium sp. NPDC002721 TaxID=3366188 RepID=UPI003689508C
MRELVADRVPFVHAVVVRAHFPTAVNAGDDAIVLPDGSIEGFVGGRCAESSVRTAALGALQDGRSVLLRVLPEGELDFPESPGAQVVVNPCLSGGALEIFLRPLLPPPVLWIAGRSPIAEALAELAAPLDLAVRRASDGQGSRSDQGPVGGQGPVDDQGPVGATAVVVCGHGRDEIPAIRAALDAGVGYVGLVASHRRGTAVLAEMDLTEAERGRIRSPAGLPIGARTAHEIALSILAEIIAAIRTRGPTPAPPPSTTGGSTTPDLPDNEPATPAAQGGGPVAPAPSDAPDSGPDALDSRLAAPGPPDSGPAASSPPRDGPGEGPSVRAVDPVCGMTVTVSPDTPHLTVDGEDVWFCCPGCRRRHAEKGRPPRTGTEATP